LIDPISRSTVLHMNLTPKQLRILQFIRDWRHHHGYSPTMQEIADLLGVSKVTVFEHIEALITKGVLVRNPNKARSLSIPDDVEVPGLLGATIDPDAEHDQFGQKRGIARGGAGGGAPARDTSTVRDGRAVPQGGARQSSVSLGGLAFPLVGRIAAGYPIEKFEQSDSLSLEEIFGPRRGQRGSMFALQVDGHSMRDEGIFDGDYVIVEQRETAKNGERVVALLPNGETTLKTFFRERDGSIRLQPANPEFAPIIVRECSIQGVVVGVLRRY
jgi:repressor LexA